MATMQKPSPVSQALLVKTEEHIAHNGGGGRGGGALVGRPEKMTERADLSNIKVAAKLAMRSVSTFRISRSF